MQITIELNTVDIIERRLGINVNGRAQLFLANEFYRRVSKYVPMRTGTLRDTVDIRADSITYLVPYARKQYYTNKGSGIRGKFWDKRMLSVENSQLQQDVQNYIRRG